ncbi:MAG: type II toxin-antitoxin system VapC family toxin [Isosphaeraceae bacterium]
MFASSITDVHYISRRLTNPENARNIVRRCLDELRVVAVTSDELETAYAFGGSDFEDDLQVACAVAASLDAIVTRDPKGFPLSPIPVLSPAELIARVREGSSDDV